MNVDDHIECVWVGDASLRPVLRFDEVETVEFLDVDTAYHELRRIQSGDGYEAAVLARLAESRGHLASNPEALALALAHELADGALVPVRSISPDLDALHRAAVRAGLLDADPRHVLLSDLLPKTPTVRFTWIEIEVVDHTGAPYAGLELDLVEHDATRHRVVLDDDGRFARKGLLDGGPATLELPDWFELTPPQRARAPIEGLRREPTDLPISREGAEPMRLWLARRHRLVVQPSTFVAFVVVDQHGVPVDGRWVCKVRATTHASAFDGSVVHIEPVAATAEVVLELEAIEPRGVVAREVRT